MNETFKKEYGDKTYDYYVKATNLSNVPPTKQFKIIVKNGTSTSEERIITAGDLTKGVYLSSYFNGRNLGKISSLSNKTNTSSIEFVGLDTVVDLKVDLLADEAVVRSNTGKVEGTLESSVLEAIKGFDATLSGTKVDGKIQYGTKIPELLGESTLKLNLKVAEESLVDLDPNKIFKVKIMKNEKVLIASRDVTAGELKDGLAIIQLGKINDIQYGNETTKQDTWSVEFLELDHELKATFELQYTSDGQSKPVNNFKKDLTIIKSEDLDLKDKAQQAIKGFYVGEQVADNNSEASSQSADKKLKFKTVLNENSEKVNPEAILNYSIKYDKKSSLGNLPENNTLTISHNGGTAKTGIKVTAKQLTDGITLRELLGSNFSLAKYSGLTVENIGTDEEPKPEYPKDEWEIEFTNLGSSVTFDIELLVNDIGLSKSTTDTTYKKSSAINRSSTGINSGLIDNSITSFTAIPMDKELTLDATISSIDPAVQGYNVDILLKSTTKDYELQAKELLIYYYNKTSEEWEYKPVTIGELTTEGKNVLSDILGEPNITYSKFKEMMDNGEIKLIFDNITGELELDVSLVFSSSVSEYTTQKKSIKLNAGKTDDFYRNLDMAINSFTAKVEEVDPDPNTPKENKLVVTTEFNKAKDTSFNKEITLVKKGNLGSAKIDAKIKLPESFNMAKDDYEIKDLTITLGTSQTNLKDISLKDGKLTIGHLREGVYLSELIKVSEANALLSAHISDNSDRTDNWIITSSDFKFATEAEVSLIIKDINVANIDNSLVFKKTTVTFNDLNNWNNYKGNIIVSENDNKVSFTFDHEVPTDFKRKSDNNTTDKLEDYKAYVERVLKELFGDSDLGLNPGSLNHKNIGITVSSSETDGMKNVVTLEFKDDVLNNNETPGNLGYKIVDLNLNSTPERKFAQPGDTNPPNTLPLNLLFQKNVLVDHDQNASTPKVQGYSAKFVDDAEVTKIKEYQSAFDNFEVTFTNNVPLKTDDQETVKNLLTVITDFGLATTAADLDNNLLDAKITLKDKDDKNITGRFNITVYYNGDMITKTGTTDGNVTLTAGSTSSDIKDGEIKLSAILTKINPNLKRNPLGSELNKFKADNPDKKDTWQFVIERNGATQENISATVELILTEPAVAGSSKEEDKVVSERSVNMTLNKPDTP